MTSARLNAFRLNDARLNAQVSTGTRTPCVVAFPIDVVYQRSSGVNPAGRSVPPRRADRPPPLGQ